MCYTYQVEVIILCPKTQGKAFKCPRFEGRIIHRWHHLNFQIFYPSHPPCKPTDALKMSINFHFFHLLLWSDVIYGWLITRNLLSFHYLYTDAKFLNSEPTNLLILRVVPIARLYEIPMLASWRQASRAHPAKPQVEVWGAISNGGRARDSPSNPSTFSVTYSSQSSRSKSAGAMLSTSQSIYSLLEWSDSKSVLTLTWAL